MEHVVEATSGSNTSGSIAAARKAAASADDSAEVETAVDEQVAQGALGGMFRHMMKKQDAEKLNLAWAKAIAHAGLPPNIINDPYVKRAIHETSMATAPYTPCDRSTMEAKYLPAYDAALDDDVKETIGDVPSRTLLFDGWDDGALNHLINFLLATPKGDEFLGDEDVTGSTQDADHIAQLA
eukprot:7386546-Prymnesium_polylepis.1